MKVLIILILIFAVYQADGKDKTNSNITKIFVSSYNLLFQTENFYITMNMLDPGWYGVDTISIFDKKILTDVRKIINTQFDTITINKVIDLRIRCLLYWSSGKIDTLGYGASLKMIYNQSFCKPKYDILKLLFPKLTNYNKHEYDEFIDEYTKFYNCE